MKNVKNNLKVVSRNVAKKLMIECSIASAEDFLVKTIIDFIPNPAAQTAVKVAGFVAYVEASKHFTKEEKHNIHKAFYDMFAGKTDEEIETEINNLVETMEDSETEEKDA